MSEENRILIKELMRKTEQCLGSVHIRASTISAKKTKAKKMTSSLS